MLIISMTRNSLLAVVLRTCLAVFAFSPAALCARTFVLPHVLEKEGTISTTPYTFDTTLYLTYNGSLHGTDKQSAQVQLFLYEHATGLPMRGAGASVCAPCTYTLDAQHRRLAIRLDDLITEAGGFNAPVKTGFGVVVVSGPGADAVNLQCLIVNSHENSRDVSVFGFDPQPILAEAQTKRTHVVPHVLENDRSASSAMYAFDTTLYATYVGGLPGTSGGAGAEVQVYLYDQAGTPMAVGDGPAICNPCTFALGDGADGKSVRKHTILIHDLIAGAGGFRAGETRLGFAVISVGGEDPANVALQSFVVNSHTSAFDISAHAFEPQQVVAETPKGASRSFMVPHIIEREGTITTPYSFDTTIFATYTPGLGTLPQGGGATAELFLYNNDGTPMLGGNGASVCAPCAFDLGPASRKQTIRMDDLIMAAGGFDTPVKLGFGVLVVSGADPDGVSLQGFIANSHTSAFDLSVFGFQPEEIRAASAVRSNFPPSRAFVIPHVVEIGGTSANTQYTYDTTLYATYAGGLPGNGAASSAALKLYLFDPATSLPLAIPMWGDVCNPCTFNLSATNRKATILMDDLISAGGGFAGGATRIAMGVVVVEGDAANVNLQGFIANAHTSPFDLSVFGFEPQPIQSSRLVPMPVQINTATANGIPVLEFPTVIGGQYLLEVTGRIDGTWQPVQAFSGDGTVLTIPLPPSGAPAQFYRVKGS